MNAKQLLKYCLMFLIKNIKVIYRYHRWLYFQFLNNGVSQYVNDFQHNRTDINFTASKDALEIVKDICINSRIDNLPIFGNTFYIDAQNVERIKNILQHQMHFINACDTTFRTDIINDARNPNSYCNFVLRALQTLDHKNKLDIQNVKEAKISNNANVGMTMLQYFKNKNKAITSYAKTCLRIDDGSNECMALYNKHRTKCNCIADLINANMHEIGDGTMIILNGNTRDSYYNYSKILSYDVMRESFSFITTYGEIPLTQESDTSKSCIIDHMHNTHICLLNEMNFKTVKVLNTLNMQWSSTNIKGGEDLGFGMNSISNNKARSSFTVNSLSEVATFNFETTSYVDNYTGKSIYFSQVPDNNIVYQMIVNGNNAVFRLEDQYLILFGGILRVDSDYQLLNDICILMAHPTLQNCMQVTYEFAWLPVQINGISNRPRERVYHSSTLLRKKHTKMMVIFGGCGVGGALNDFAVLDISSLKYRKCVQWLEVDVRGNPPTARYHHKALKVSETQFYIIGGSNARTRDDLYLVTLENASVTATSGRANLLCEKVNVEMGTFPESSSFRSATYSRHKNAIYVFGGQSIRNSNDENTFKGMYKLQLPALNEDFVKGHRISRIKSVVEDFGELPCISIPKHNFGHDMIKLFESALFTDVDFKVIADQNQDDGNNGNSLEKPNFVTVKAHKCILVARSERFKALLLGGMSESCSETGKPIVLNGVRESVFKALLSYIYSDSLLESVRADYQLVMELYIVANEYTLLRLIRLCEGILLRLLEVENAAEFLEFSDQYGMADTIVDQRKRIQDMEASLTNTRRQCLICLTYDDDSDNSIHSRCKTCRHESFRLINTKFINTTKKVQCSILKEGCISFILRNYKDVQATEGYQCLSRKLTNEIIDCYKLSVYSTDANTLESNGLLHVVCKTNA